MRAVLPRSVFTVSGRDYDWGHVVLAGHLWTEWASLLDEVGEAIACVRNHGEPAAAVVQDAAGDFRYHLGLLAADEMEAWLTRWQLTVDDWMSFIRRHMARRACVEPDHSARTNVTPDELWAEAVCTSTHEGLARRLAAAVAVGGEPGASAASTWEPVESLAGAFGGWDALGMSPAAAETDLAGIAQLDARLRDFERDAVDDDEIAREIEARKFDWTTYECDVLELATLDAALEAALCLRLDGMEPAEVAERAGVSVDRRRVALEEADALGTLLLAAEPGSVIGPITTGDGHLVVVIRTRTVPSVSDDEARERASGRLLSRLVDAEIQAQVLWREHI